MAHRPAQTSGAFHPGALRLPRLPSSIWVHSSRTAGRRGRGCEVPDPKRLPAPEVLGPASVWARPVFPCGEGGRGGRRRACRRREPGLGGRTGSGPRGRRVRPSGPRPHAESGVPLRGKRTDPRGPLCAPLAPATRRSCFPLPASQWGSPELEGSELAMPTRLFLDPVGVRGSL